MPSSNRCHPERREGSLTRAGAFVVTRTTTAKSVVFPCPSDRLSEAGDAARALAVDPRAPNRTLCMQGCKIAPWPSCCEPVPSQISHKLLIIRSLWLICPGGLVLDAGAKEPISGRSPAQTPPPLAPRRILRYHLPWHTVRAGGDDGVEGRAWQSYPVFC